MDGGSLQDLVDNGGCRHEPTLATIARGALLGLRFLHACKQLHRDLKPANLLIDRLGRVKVSDFGIARQLDDADEAIAEHAASSSTLGIGGKRDVGAEAKGDAEAKGGEAKNDKSSARLASAHTFVGTVTFMSPERINGDSYSTPSDVWSLGLTIMTCALGKLPFNAGGGYWSILQAVRDADPPTLPTGGDHFWSDEFRAFLGRCLKKDPADRASCRELLDDPWLAHAERKREHVPDPDRGKDELDTVVAALYAHLKGMRDRLHTLSPKSSGTGAAGTEAGGGGDDVPGALRKLLLDVDLTGFAHQLGLEEAYVRRTIEAFLNDRTAAGSGAGGRVPPSPQATTPVFALPAPRWGDSLARGGGGAA